MILIPFPLAHANFSDKTEVKNFERMFLNFKISNLIFSHHKKITITFLYEKFKIVLVFIHVCLVIQFCF